MIDFGLFRLELWTCALIGLIFTVDLFIEKKAFLRAVAALGSFGLLVFSLVFDGQGTTFFDAFVSDDLSLFFKTLFLLNAFLVIVLSSDFLKKNPRYTAEYFILILSATLGMFLMVSSRELITFYIALELLSISSYVLAAYHKAEAKSTEAGIKYLLLGAMASGILLFGLSLIYGATGSLHLTEIAAFLKANSAPAVLYIGMAFVLVALSFKIAAVPFHMWAPDVYEGAPTPVVAFFSVGTKAAGFAVLIRIFLTAFGGIVMEWAMIAAVLSAATIIVGNLLAVPQTNIKRFMGYSSIAQAGYVLMGLAAANASGISASLFYLVAYLFSNLCAFAVIIVFSRQANDDSIDAYRGLARRSPFLALALLVSLMSLGGVPPLVGFLGKLYLFFGVIEREMTWLAAVGILMSVVSIYYYLMILKRAYIDPPSETAAVEVSFPEKSVIVICMLGIVIFGLWPFPVFDFILSVTKAFMYHSTMPF